MSDDDDDEKCGSKCLPGVGCSPVVKMQADFSSFMTAATQSMKDHSEISEMVWKNASKEIGQLVDNTRECFKNMNEAALRMNDGAHVMQSLRDDITAIASHSRDELARLEQHAKDELLRIEEHGDDELERHESGKFGAHNVIKNQITWHRRILYVFVGAFMTLGGWSLLLTIFIVKTHPEFIDMIWAWVK